MDKPEFFARASDEAYRAQVEAGNITQSDVDILNNIQEKVVLYKRVGLYGGASVATIYARYVRKPRWNIPRTLAFSTVGAIAGLGLSAFATVRLMLRSMEGFEDKDRFVRAVQILKPDAATHRTPGLGLPTRMPPARRPGSFDNSTEPSDAGSSWVGASDSNSGTANDAPFSASADGSSSAPPVEDHSSPQPDDSRWAEIRAERAPNQMTTWDRLRKQTTQNTKTPGPGPATRGGFASGTNSNGTPAGPPEVNDDLKDQAKFDALLEAERNIGQEQGMKGSGSPVSNRWS